MSDRWLQEQIAPDGVEEDGCHPDEARALEDHCCRTTEAIEAAKAIVQPIEQSEDPGAHLYRLWNLLIDALMQLPETQIPSLVQLLDAIQKLPKPDLKGREVTPHGHLWEGLPGFGHMWADEHKQGHWRDSLAAALKEGANRMELRAAHVRKANVEARLTAAGIGRMPLDWGYECIADALERQGAVVDFEMPAAAEWLEVAGDQLYAGVRTGCTSRALERRRDFGRENAVMTVERWLFWKQRLEELEEQVQVGLGATKSAGQVMNTIERGSDE
ncbi:MAG: hypothetical protein LQ348_003419 [Seirophora lacunosa]|nr:MAG: hypothetical protein LQ348_003419 [Seirophora lacunosa]